VRMTGGDDTGKASHAAIMPIPAPLAN